MSESPKQFDKRGESRRERIQRVRDFLKVWRVVRGKDDTICITGAATVLRTSDLLHVIETIDIAQELLNRAKERGELMDVPQFAPSHVAPNAERVRLILKGYADSYRQMDRDPANDGNVMAGSVYADFTNNIIPQVLEALAFAASATLCIGWETVKAIRDELHAFGSMAGPSRCGASISIAVELDQWLSAQPEYKAAMRAADGGKQT